MMKTLNDIRTVANPAVSYCFGLAYGWHDTHVVHVSSSNVVHIAVLIKYTLVSQITHFHYACILLIDLGPSVSLRLYFTRCFR